ncbi:MAG: site-specific DNA-methyltransferase [Bdellovibrionales bacterium]|nr:site-specific DNA-methyltransferase [Bdellovibrionales bacterium]
MKNNSFKFQLAKVENLEWLSTLNSHTLKKHTGKEYIQFIYIDPPFNTLREQKKVQDNSWDSKVQNLEYYDSYGEGLSGYIEFMKMRLEHMYRLLDPKKGFLCVHLDYNSVHYIKKTLDYIFGGGNLDRGRKHLVNEIIVSRTRGKNSGGAKQLNIEFDTLLLYKKSRDMKLNKIYCEKKQKAQWRTDCERDHKRPSMEYTLLGVKPKNRWQWSEETALQYVNNYELFKKSEYSDIEKYWIKVKNKDRSFRFIRKNEKTGNLEWWKPPSDKTQVKHNVWFDIKAYDSSIPYPTAKHTDLLDRLIEMCSKEGDLVADFFCGCGVTMKSSIMKNRSFIGCDGQSKAIEQVKDGISKIKKDVNLEEIEVFKSPELDKITDNHKFARECVLMSEGVPSYRDSGDMSVDGIRCSS